MTGACHISKARSPRTLCPRKTRLSAMEAMAEPCLHMFGVVVTSERWMLSCSSKAAAAAFSADEERAQSLLSPAISASRLRLTDSPFSSAAWPCTRW